MAIWGTVQWSDLDLLCVLEGSNVGRLKRYVKGSMLYLQSEPADSLFVIKKGKVKTSSVSPEGKVYTYGIVGEGHLVADVAFILGGECESMCEALESTDVYILSREEFTDLMSTCPSFSEAVIAWLAQGVRVLARQARDLGLADVQQRLKHQLAWLADEHGLVTEKGVRIDLDITHEEISELVAADRTTVTARLNELRRQGYLWKEGRRLVVPPPEHRMILDGLSQAVVEGDEQGAIRWANKAMQGKVDPIKALEALTSGMRQVDKGFVRGELALPDVIMAALAMKSAMPLVEGEIKRTGKKVVPLGTVVIGTVRGDIHDIGKTMVASLFVAGGFKVIDLGIDVTPEQFIEAVQEHRPDILAMSALMTTTVPEQTKVINALKQAGLREKVKIMVGGGAVTQELSERIGADGHEPVAREAVELAKKLITEKRG